MGEKLQAFRWLGRGYLKIEHPDGRVIMVPPYTPRIFERECIVKSQENLAVLGAARIAHFFAEKVAEPVNWVEGAMDMLKKDASVDDASPELSELAKEKADAQTVVQDSTTISRDLGKRAKALKESGDPAANAKDSIGDLMDKVDAGKGAKPTGTPAPAGPAAPSAGPAPKGDGK
jgi:hypothetical protein